jgi:hypothetical protein
VKVGDAYKTVFTCDNNREPKTAQATFDAVETDTVRFVIRESASSVYPNAAQLSELEVYAQ